MFPFGALLALLGYTGTYVGVCRLAGDQRTVMSIVKGDNGGKMIKGSDSSSSSGGGILGGLGLSKSSQDHLTDLNPLTNSLSPINPGGITNPLTGPVSPLGAANDLLKKVGLPSIPGIG